MAKTWQLMDAKNRFSELVNLARHEGPQTVTRRGRPVAVVVSTEEYAQLVEPEGDLVSFLRDSPLVGVDLDIERDQTPVRDVEL